MSKLALFNWHACESAAVHARIIRDAGNFALEHGRFELAAHCFKNARIWESAIRSYANRIIAHNRKEMKS